MLTTLDHLVLTVADIDATTRFYSGALGMEAISFTASGGGTRHALRYGSQKINLHPAGTAYEPRARVPTPGSADLCFLTDMPLEAWQSRLAGHGIEIIEGP
ncbi:MAG: VOC family protein, partial [Paracoccus sp. (in: a-proteobacteria)]